MRCVTLVLILVVSSAFSWGQQSLNEAVIGAYRFEIPSIPDSNGVFVAVHPMESIVIDSNFRASKSSFNPYDYSHCADYIGEAVVSNDTLTITYTSTLHTCDIDNIHLEGVYPEMIEKYQLLVDSNAVQSIVGINSDKKEFKRFVLERKEQP